MLFSRRLRVLVLNGHVGVPIKNGAVQWILARHRVDLILAQEIRNASVLKRALGPEWDISPVEQPFESKDREAMTYVCFRTRRFELLHGWNLDITFGEVHPRRMTAARLLDRRTGQTILASSVHVAPLGKGLVRGNANVRNLQTRQLTAYAGFLSTRPGEEIRLAGGDFNQRLGEKVPTILVKHSAHEIFGNVGLKASRRIRATGTAGLLDLFVPANDKRVKVIARETFTIPIPGMDHEVVLVRLRIRRKRR